MSERRAFDEFEAAIARAFAEARRTAREAAEAMGTGRKGADVISWAHRHGIRFDPAPEIRRAAGRKAGLASAAARAARRVAA